MGQIYDVSGNVIRVAHTDASETGRVAFETIEDNTATVESARHLRDAVSSKDTFRHVARVPVTVYEQALREGWADDMQAWDRWMNNPDNAAFRVWQGRL